MGRICNAYGGRGVYRVLLGKPEGKRKRVKGRQILA
jgi:hypothetical protein